MALTVRYFSTTGAGAADGTTWADRAELFSSGNWSTVLTGFDFSANAMEARVEGGLTYTCSQALASGLFTNAPTAANPLIVHGCDSSGNRLTPSNPDWVSAQPVDWDSGLPVIATTTNIVTTSLANTVWLHCKFTASGRNGAIISAHAYMEWCVGENSTANTSAQGVSTSANAYSTRCAWTCSGSSYASVVSGAAAMSQCRISGVAGSSGNRRGVDANQATTTLVECAILGVGGDGVIYSGSSTSQQVHARNCVIANVGGTGFKSGSTASQTAWYDLSGCIITGCGAYGADAQSAGRLVAANNRLRDNTSGNFNGFGNYPTDLNTYTTDAADSDDYVDASGGDYRIKNTAAIWGQGYGVADEPAASGGSFPSQGLQGIETGVCA